VEAEEEPAPTVQPLFDGTDFGVGGEVKGVEAVGQSLEAPSATTLRLDQELVSSVANLSSPSTSEARSTSQAPNMTFVGPVEFSSIDCGTKTCDVIYEVLETCIVYMVPKLPTPNCSVPCEVSGCDKIILHYTNCAVWNCVDNNGTTTTTTPSPGPGPGPVPPSPMPAHGGYAASVTFNVLFSVLLLGILAMYKKEAIRDVVQRIRRRNDYNDLESGSGPIFRPSAPPAAVDDDAGSPASGSGFQDVPIFPRGLSSSPQPRSRAERFRDFWANLRSNQN